MKSKKQKGAAFLWDESFLWGLMACKALRGLGLPFDFIKAEDVKAGELDKYRMLFVPGGWASNKSRALGEDGIKAIQNFVKDGGSYLGFCGGAGLATKAKGGIGLLNVKRRPTKERVPSFSGRIELNLTDHPIWKTNSEEERRSTPDARRPTVFNAWWPSQLDDVNVLATYGDALPDSFSSDLNVGDVERNGNWSDLEKIYKINLDPKRLLNEPSVIEGSYGEGKVVLSLVHSPDDLNGQQVLINLWEYLTEEKPEQRTKIKDNRLKKKEVSARDREYDSLCSLLFVLCSDLISLGERNFLWFWRNSMLLQWRRGVRGLEYNAIYVLIKEIAENMETRNADKSLGKINNMLNSFVEKAKRLLILERHALQKGHITYEKCDDHEIKKIRSELFSDSKSHGGMFKDLIDKVDKLLFVLIGNKK
jgi:glutamine amidotransferase-like uncharacterized protein